MTVAAAMATSNSIKRGQLVRAMGKSNGKQAIAAATTAKVATGSEDRNGPQERWRQQERWQ